MTMIRLFDVIGPNMVGPSSSHTAGAAAIGLLSRKMFQGEIKKVDFILYGSFAKTYRGHGTDKALVGGVMGFETDDLRIKDSLSIADERALIYSFSMNESETEVHPNTVDILIEGTAGKQLLVRGVSVGGGKIKIVKLNNVDVEFTGEYSTLIVIQTDKPGVVAHITACLSKAEVNIAFMRLFRENKGKKAYTVIESDEKIPPEVTQQIKANKNVHDIMLIQL